MLGLERFLVLMTSSVVATTVRLDKKLKLVRDELACLAVQIDHDEACLKADKIPLQRHYENLLAKRDHLRDSVKMDAGSALEEKALLKVGSNVFAVPLIPQVLPDSTDPYGSTREAYIEARLDWQIKQRQAVAKIVSDVRTWESAYLKFLDSAEAALELKNWQAKIAELHAIEAELHLVSSSERNVILAETRLSLLKPQKAKLDEACTSLTTDINILHEMLSKLRKINEKDASQLTKFIKDSQAELKDKDFANDILILLELWQAQSASATTTLSAGVASILIANPPAASMTSASEMAGIKPISAEDRGALPNAFIPS